MSKVEEAIVLLLKAYFNGKQEPAPAISLSEQEWADLQKAAFRHSIEGIICGALNYCETNIPESVAKSLCTAYVQSFYIYGKQRKIYGQLCQALDEAGVPNLRIKGMRLSEYYPEPELRTSCDIDILYHKEHREQVFEVMQQNGFTHQEASDKDDLFASADGFFVEMHYSLFNEYRQQYMQTFDPWQNAVACDGYRFRYDLRQEDHYVYLLFHFGKHIQVGGASIRHLLDLEMLLRRSDMQVDREYCRQLLEKYSLTAFEQAVRHLLDVWFRGEERNEMDAAVEYVLFRKTGSVFEQEKKMFGVASQDSNSGRGKLRYLLRRFWGSKESLWSDYPIARKHKILTPIYRVVRWFRLLSPKTRKRIDREVKYVQSIDQGELETLKTLTNIMPH